MTASILSEGDTIASTSLVPGTGEKVAHGIEIANTVRVSPCAGGLFVAAGAPAEVATGTIVEPVIPRGIVPADTDTAGSAESARLADRLDVPASNGPIVTLCGFPADRFAISGSGGKLFRRVVRLVDATDALPAEEKDDLTEWRELAVQQIVRDVLLYVVRTEHEQEDREALTEALAVRAAEHPGLPALAIRDKQGVTTTREFFGTGYICETVAIPAEELALVATIEDSEGDGEGAEDASEDAQNRATGKEEAAAACAAINAYFERKPIGWGFDTPDMTREGGYFIEAFHAGGEIALVDEAQEAIIRDGLSVTSGGTIAEMQKDFRRAVADRRAFYEAVREFVNDPATWAHLDAQDAMPDFEAVADALRAEGIAVFEDTLTPPVANAPTDAQEARTGEKCNSADTCGGAVEVIDLTGYHTLQAKSQETLVSLLDLVASGDLNADNAADFLKAIKTADSDIEGQSVEGGAA